MLPVWLASFLRVRAAYKAAFKPFCSTSPSPKPQPPPGDKLQLQGLNAFDAAVHCASLSNKPGVEQAGGNNRAPKRPAGPFSRLLAALGCRTSGGGEAPVPAVGEGGAPAAP